MSNPGVLYLAEGSSKKGKFFRVEDNIGESIHIHYKDFRLDLTINDFIDITSELEASVERLIEIDNFNILKLDPLFLESIAYYIKDLERVEMCEMQLSELVVKTKGLFNLPVMRSLIHSRVTKALNGNTKDQVNYKQINHIDQSSIERLSEIKESVCTNGYPYNGEYIILFNDQNVIRDGQHRAGCLLHIHGDIKIPVIRMNFKNRKYNVSNYPYIEFLLRGNKHRLFALLRTIRNRVARRLHRLRIKFNFQ